MDQQSLELLETLLTDRLARIEAICSAASPGRGHRMIALARIISSSLAGEKDRVVQSYTAAGSDDERRAVLRRLLRLLQLSEVLSLLKPYVDDIGRRDVPLGLWRMIDLMIAGLLPNGADAIIHFDDHHMYATADLAAGVATVLSTLGTAYADPIRPVVFFVPGTDPTNALLLPILAHEVGHTAVEQANLGSATLSKVDITALNQLFDKSLKAAGNPPPGPWQVQLFRWVDELLCDALATVLTGPSLLLSSAMFLPAPNPGALSSHPFPADRLRLSLEQLDRLGWLPLVTSVAPGIVQWLRGLQVPTPSDPPRQEFLRGAIEILKPAIFEVSENHVREPLNPVAFTAVQTDLVALLTDGIPVAEVSGSAVQPWAIVLAAWLSQIGLRGDAPRSLASATADRQFNSLVHKSIELSGILTIWKSL